MSNSFNNVTFNKKLFNNDYIQQGVSSPNPFKNTILKRKKIITYENIHWVSIHNLRNSLNKKLVSNCVTEPKIIYWYLDKDKEELHWSRIDEQLKKMNDPKFTKYESYAQPYISGCGSDKFMKFLGLSEYKVSTLDEGHEYWISINEDNTKHISVLCRKLCKKI